jgi:methionine aminopeptidase
VSIDDPAELAALRAAGRVVAETLRELRRAVLRAGELVKLDVTAELDGFYADACVAVPVGRVRPRAQRLGAAAGAALRCGVGAARAGAQPIIAAGAGDVHLAPDGWIIRTDDGPPSAHAEHTIVLTAGAPIVLTA